MASVVDPPPEGAHAATSAVNAAPLAPLSSVRRLSPPSRTQRPPPTTTGAVAPELGAQSEGPQCDGGFAISSGLTILPAMVPTSVLECAHGGELLAEIGY